MCRAEGKLIQARAACKSAADAAATVPILVFSRQCSEIKSSIDSSSVTPPPERDFVVDQKTRPADSSVPLAGADFAPARHRRRR